MNKMTKLTSVIMIVAIGFVMFATTVQAELSSNNSSGAGSSSGSLGSNNSGGAGGSTGSLGSNNSSGAGAYPTPSSSVSPSPLASNNSSGAGASTGSLSSNNSSGAGASTGGLSSNNSSGAGMVSTPTPTPTPTGTPTPSPTPTPSTQTGGGASGASSYSSSSGSIMTLNVLVSKFTVLNAGGNNFRVSWITNIPTRDQVVFGRTSKPAATKGLNFGYQASSNVDPIPTTVHSFVITLQPNVKYYLRPISTNAITSFYGKEYRVENVRNVSSQTVVTPGTPSGSSVNVDIKGSVIDTTDSTSTSIDTAAAANAGQKMGFFKRIWHFLIGR